MEKEFFETRFEKVFDGKLLPLNFGTVRIHNPNEYYLGAKHKIWLDNQEIGEATVLAVRSFTFNTLRTPITLLDGNLEVNLYAANFKRLYNHEVKGGIKEDTMLDHIIFHWNNRSFPIHVTILNEYYAKILEDGKFTNTEPR